MENQRKPYNITCIMVHNEFQHKFVDIMYLNDEELKEMRHGLNTLINALITNDSVNASLSFHDENDNRKTYALSKIVFLYTDIDVNIIQNENTQYEY